MDFRSVAGASGLAGAAMRKALRDNGLTIVLLAIFVATTIGMAMAGLSHENAERAAHGQPPLTIGAYILSAGFLSALTENWESEFLQMSAYVMLTAYLFQRGSAESLDPDDPDRPGDERAPPGLGGWLYAHSLGIALALLFAASFVWHWLASASAANEKAAAHGQPQHSAWAHLADAEFWFESLQNWQSEFLATAVLVVLSIFLRYRHSPESKTLADADGKTGAGE